MSLWYIGLPTNLPDGCWLFCEKNELIRVMSDDGTESASDNGLAAWINHRRERCKLLCSVSLPPSLVYSDHMSVWLNRRFPAFFRLLSRTPLPAQSPPRFATAERNVGGFASRSDAASLAPISRVTAAADWRLCQAVNDRLPAVFRLALQHAAAVPRGRPSKRRTSVRQSGGAANLVLISNICLLLGRPTRERAGRSSKAGHDSSSLSVSWGLTEQRRTDVYSSRHAAFFDYAVEEPNVMGVSHPDEDISYQLEYIFCFMDIIGAYGLRLGCWSWFP